MNTTYAKACDLGYPYIRGNPKLIKGLLCNRFSKTEDGNPPAVYVGWKVFKDSRRKNIGEWIIEYEVQS